MWYNSFLGGDILKIKDLTPQERYKRYNDRNKLKYDRFGIALKKGLKEKIQSKGESVNGLVNKLVKNWIAENYPDETL